MCIVIFLLCLAVFDLFVGVSNDAVNFLQSAIGAKVAKFRTVLIIASVGVVLGAVMSSGMMDVARHGIMNPARYNFYEVMTIFLAVMVTDVIVLDVFNTLGMPTSTTVSLVFELLGGTFILACMKMGADHNLTLNDLLNSSEALKVIGAIFISVAVAFVVGMIVMWLSRIVFTFNYHKHSRWSIAIFGGIAFTALAYFIFLKGLGKSPYLPGHVRDYIDDNVNMLIAITFVISSVIAEILHLLKVNIFKITVLLGTFALAMAFAGNDLINFIGVPLAGLSSWQDYSANAAGQSDTQFMMTSLLSSAKTPPFYLFAAGVVMIVAMGTSKKARNVVKTSVDLSRQDEGSEMFGSSAAARGIVRMTRNSSEWLAMHLPKSLLNWIDSRFNKNEVELDNGAAFDVVRAAVNLVISSMLITFGTNHGLPLSTTYVTFMVAMGSSLADRAWSRQSAVFRITGVLSVIGGWFITAGLTFIICSVICLIIYKCGFVAIIILMAACVTILVKNNLKKRRSADAESDMIYSAMMKSHDPVIIHDLLNKHVAKTQSDAAEFTRKQINVILNALCDNDPSKLRKSVRAIDRKKQELKKEQKREILCMRKLPAEDVIERNTWFYLGMNSAEQYMYCLKRMIEPIKDHIDNNFTPMPQEYADECKPIIKEAEELMRREAEMIKERNFAAYDATREEAEKCKKQLSALRYTHTKRMQYDKNKENLRISLVYLNTLQEIQMIISTMRHQLRASKKFNED